MDRNNILLDYFFWIYYEIKYLARKKKFTLCDSVSKKMYGCNSNHDIKRYVGKNVLDIEETNLLIYKKILDGTPFWAGRFGGNELLTVVHFLRNRMYPIRTDARKLVLHDLCIGAGFFPEEIEQANKFVELMLDTVRDIDLIGVWNLYMEEYILKKYATDVQITRLTRLEPWKVYMSKTRVTPWTAALKGKRVLVIHPFQDSIINQYKNNRERIFETLEIPDLLPEFELITLKAVQSAAGEETEFDNWFLALESMINQCKNIEFDVAIIGCGAYGFPLAAAIKRMGKIAIHLGGATQLLFGIRGKRWDDETELVYKKMINDSWVRPIKQEQISKKEMIERGCYW